MKLFTRKRLIRFVYFSVVIILFSASFFIYRKSVSSIITKTSEVFLEDSATLYAGIIKSKINENFIFLNKISKELESLNFNDINAVQKALSHIQICEDISDIFVTNEAGIALNKDNINLGNVSYRRYFQKTLSECKNQVSEIIISDLNGNPSIILTAPVFNKGQVCGIVAAVINLSVIDNLFSCQNSKSSAYFLIADDEGSVIFANTKDNRLCYDKNLYQFFQKNRCWNLAESISYFENHKLNKSGFLNYHYGKEKRFCFYMPFDVNGWYMFTSIPQDFIGTTQAIFSKLTLILVLAVALILLASLVITIFYSVRMEAASLDSKRLNIVISKNQSLILDIDLIEKSISYTGDTFHIFGKHITKTDLTSLDKLIDKVHPEDKMSVDDFKQSVFVTHTDYFSEFRLKCDDESYNWYKITTLTIYDEAHKPLKCMATFENVNQRILREQELQHKADYDSLSGLLNKGGFERKVREFITQNPANICALFVIDLDNFKATNDTLGHSMGDIAISDTAKKISLIFSIKDCLGRIGGDEFCVFSIFDRLFTEEECISLVNEKAKSLCEIINEMYFNDEKYVEISASIGIAIFPSQGKNYEDLFHMADNALYNVKHSGKNGFKFYTPDMEAKSELIYNDKYENSDFNDLF